MKLSLYAPQQPCRLKTFLRHWGISGSYWKKLKNAGAIQVNGNEITGDGLLEPGDRITLTFLPEELVLVPEQEPITILYEDELFLAVDKPAGLITHNNDASGAPSLSRRVAWYYTTHHVLSAIHPVSRLDKETSGVVLFAKNSCIHYMVSRQHLEKTYLGLCLGTWQIQEGVMDEPIARKPGSIIERQIDPMGQQAITHYKVLRQKEQLSLVRFQLGTGRTHQIRVHCAAAGHPLLGDHLYGKPGPQGRHFLHAYELSFLHPITKKRLAITAPLPADMEEIIQKEL